MCVYPQNSIVFVCNGDLGGFFPPSLSSRELKYGSTASLRQPSMCSGGKAVRRANIMYAVQVVLVGWGHFLRHAQQRNVVSDVRRQDERPVTRYTLRSRLH